ncbi:hypothetical protein [Streptococcus ruminantium]|uniref:hypothetical protein n=1 Tax=Streptococcus ruminantium TaxID=1917441 RepID=UPI0012DE7709|nr:hypothetical protein [Streptococcus ruminantium]
MELAESTRLGVVGYLMLTMGVTLPKATEILEELETSGLVNVKTGGQLEIILLEGNHESH